MDTFVTRTSKVVEPAPAETQLPNGFIFFSFYRLQSGTFIYFLFLKLVKIDTAGLLFSLFLNFLLFYVYSLYFRYNLLLWYYLLVQ